MDLVGGHQRDKHGIPIYLFYYLFQSDYDLPFILVPILGLLLTLLALALICCNPNSPAIEYGALVPRHPHLPFVLKYDDNGKPSVLIEEGDTTLEDEATNNSVVTADSKSGGLVKLVDVGEANRMHNLCHNQEVKTADDSRDMVMNHDMMQDQDTNRVEEVNTTVVTAEIVDSWEVAKMQDQEIKTAKLDETNSSQNHDREQELDVGDSEAGYGRRNSPTIVCSQCPHLV